MNSIRLPSPAALLIALLGACAAHVSAQTYSIGTTGDSQSWDVYGQSFMPSAAGAEFPAAPASAQQVSLHSVSFAQFNTGLPPASVYILEESLLTGSADLQETIAAVLANPSLYILGESEAASVAPGLLDGDFPGDYHTLTYDFTGGITLDSDTRYVTLFSDGLGRIRVVGAGPLGAYASGSIYDTTGFDLSFDASFIATFSVIPEPATYVLLMSAVVVVAATLRRRRNA
ncbi:MAG TPA: PEP-CTERM sorting domain-containing protein [Rariglobus sp.]